MVAQETKLPSLFAPSQETRVNNPRRCPPTSAAVFMSSLISSEDIWISAVWMNPITSNQLTTIFSNTVGSTKSPHGNAEIMSTFGHAQPSLVQPKNAILVTSNLVVLITIMVKLDSMMIGNTSELTPSTIHGAKPLSMVPWAAEAVPLSSSVEALVVALGQLTTRNPSKCWNRVMFYPCLTGKIPMCTSTRIATSSQTRGTFATSSSKSAQISLMCHSKSISQRLQQITVSTPHGFISTSSQETVPLLVDGEHETSI